MDSSRRCFLKMAGIAAVGLGARPAVQAAAATDAHDPKTQVRKDPRALKAKQWAMVIDTRKLKEIEPLVEACHTAHNVPQFSNRDHEIKWIWETRYHNAFPDTPNFYQSHEVEQRPFAVLCNHCENPPCVRACPTQATFKREDGIVLMDFHRCIGCRFCMAACPFGARSFNFKDPRGGLRDKDINKAFPTRMMGVVEKCNFCAERLAIGKMPICVEASNGAMVFGDLKDPHSEVREVLSHNYTIRRRQSLGTEPCVYYIV